MWNAHRHPTKYIKHLGIIIIIIIIIEIVLETHK